MCFQCCGCRLTASPIVKDSNRQSYSHNESVKQRGPHGSTRKHNTLYSGAIIYSVDWFSNFQVWLTVILSDIITHKNWNLPFISFEYKCFVFISFDSIANVPSVSRWDRRRGGCCSSSVPDFLSPRHGGHTTEQGTLSCVVSWSSLTSDRPSYNSYRSRRDACESGSCLEVIVAQARRCFSRNHENLFPFFFFLSFFPFGSLKVVTV